MVHTTDSGFSLCFSSVLLTDVWWEWDTEFHCTGLLLPLTERERTGQSANQPSFPLPNLSLLNGSSGSENNESYCHKKKISANQLQPAPPLHDVPALLSSETQISTKFYWQHPAEKARQAWSLWTRQEWWAAHLVRSTPPCERFEALPMHAILRTERTASCLALVRSPCRVIETLFIVSTWAGGRNIYHWFRKDGAKLWCLTRVLGKNQGGSAKMLPGLLMENTSFLELFMYTFVNAPASMAPLQDTRKIMRSPRNSPGAIPQLSLLVHSAR